MAGNWKPAPYGAFIAMRDGGTDIAGFGPAVPKDKAAVITAERDAIMKGKQVYAGPLADRDGKERVASRRGAVRCRPVEDGLVRQGRGHAEVRPEEAMPNALELTGIRKSFDGFAALTDAHFAARWGEVHALLGENGAGKSSLMNIAAGLYAPEAGQLLVDDNAVRFAGPRDAAKHRIGMVHQHFKLVRPFTVAQNILLTAPPPAELQSHGERLREIERDIRNKASELGFDIDPSKRIDALSIAEQQRVEILKVLLAGARILILDEPTAVLTDQEAARLLQTVQGLARAGSAVVLVTHKMADVKTYADRVTVMRGGRTVATLKPGEASVAELVKLTVGESIADARIPGVDRIARPRAPFGARVAHTRLARRPAACSTAWISSCTRARSTAWPVSAATARANWPGAIMGLPGEATEGEIRLEGHGDLKTMAASARRGIGLAAIPADRYGLALAGGLSVAENYAIGRVHTGRYGRLAPAPRPHPERRAGSGARLRRAGRALGRAEGRAAVGRQRAEAGARARVRQVAHAGAGAQPEPRARRARRCRGACAAARRARQPARRCC